MYFVIFGLGTVMTCLFSTKPFGTKPLYEPMMTYCKIEHRNKTLPVGNFTGNFEDMS